MATTLSTSMTLTAFDHGYWYAKELRLFAGRIGVPSHGLLRKDELEKAVRRFLQTGRVSNPTGRAPSRTGTTDVERGLSLDSPVRLYTNDAKTKDFLERQAVKLSAGYRRRSGARYRLNRWREAQLMRGVPITYRDLVIEYIRLSGLTRFSKVPHGRYINFVAEFRASEPGQTMGQAVAAWKALKALDAPKTYASWVKHKSGRPPHNRSC